MATKGALLQLFPLLLVAILTIANCALGRPERDGDWYGHDNDEHGGWRKDKSGHWHKRKDGHDQPGCEGDPHFSGADSSHFDFTGVPNTTYCLLSDSHVAVNAYFGGYYGEYEGRQGKSITWMREIGILWGHHSIVMKVRQGADASYGNGYMDSIIIDNDIVSLSSPGDKATFGAGQASVSWLSAKEKSGSDLIDVYAVDINNVLSIILELRPEIPEFRTETDGTVHFDVYFPIARLSDNVHGILGQTYRSDHKNRIAGMKLQYSMVQENFVVPGDNGEGYLDGAVSDYVTSGITATDSLVNRFANMVELDPETSLALELSSGGVPSVLSSSGAVTMNQPSGTTYKRLKKLRLFRKFSKKM